MTLAHYCDDGYFVEQQAREDCWWRHWTNQQTDLDLLLATNPDDLLLDSNGPLDIRLLRIEDEDSLRGYSAPSHAAFGQLTPGTFSWQETQYTIIKLAINLNHRGPDDWTVLMEFSPTRLQNAERLALQAGDQWLSFSDARNDSGRLYWHGVMPGWTNGETVPVRIRAFPESFAPRSIDGSGNNRANPDLGRANTPLLRRSPVYFTYGMTSTPMSADNVPNPRDISNIVFDQPELVPNRYRASDMVSQWGQFIDHDITLVLEGEAREALPIPVPIGDPIFDALCTGSYTIPFFALSLTKPLAQARTIRGSKSIASPA